MARSGFAGVGSVPAAGRRPESDSRHSGGADENVPVAATPANPDRDIGRRAGGHERVIGVENVGRIVDGVNRAHQLSVRGIESPHAQNVIVVTKAELVVKALCSMTPGYQIAHPTDLDLDLDLFPEIERAASALFPEGRIPDPDDVMPRGELERAASEGLLITAACDGQVVGFAMAREDGDVLYLAVMAVHPDHGRRGIGTGLTKAVIDASVARRLRGVTLTTFRDLPWNAPFYAKLGFEAVPEAEVSPSLRSVLAKEEKEGMTNRIAMRYKNAA